MHSRRVFGSGLASSIAASALPRAARASTRIGLSGLLPQAHDGALHVLGAFGNDHPAAPRNSKQPHAVLTSIDLGSHRLHQTVLPMPNGHSAVGLGEGRILCMPQEGDRCLVVEAAHKIMRELQAPAGYQFFGHALIRPAGQETLVLSLKRIDYATVNDHGLLAVYDLADFRMLAVVTSGGLNPHEIVPIPGTEEVCAVHYGNVSVQAPPRVRNVKDAKLSIFDGRTLALKREYPQHDIAAVLSHLRVDGRGNAYCALQQFVVVDKEIKSPAERLARYSAYCAEIIGRAVRFEHPPQIDSGQMPVPLPILRIDTRTGEREVILSADDHHLAVQTVEVNRQTQTTVVSYTVSNALVLRAPGNPPFVVEGKAMRIEFVRGVAEVPGTPFVLATSSVRGIAAVDTRSGAVVGHADVPFYGAAHAYFSST